MAEQQNTNGGGRILHEQQELRVVELGWRTDVYSYPTYQQKVVVMDTSGWNGPMLRLIAPDVEGFQREVPLTFEEADVLISAYQSFLADRRAAQEAAEASRVQSESHDDDDDWF